MTSHFKKVSLVLLLLTFIGAHSISLHASEINTEQIMRDLEEEKSSIAEQRRQFLEQALANTTKLDDAFWKIDESLYSQKQQYREDYLGLIRKVTKNLHSGKLTSEESVVFLNRYIELEEALLAHKKFQVETLLLHFDAVFVARVMQADRKFEAFIQAGIAAKIPYIQ